jgi:hypothetical protein
LLADKVCHGAAVLSAKQIWVQGRISESSGLQYI